MSGRHARHFARVRTAPDGGRHPGAALGRAGRRRAGVTVHVKNGWLPVPQLWVINSIGAFTSDDDVYTMVVLTQDNPAMVGGIDLVQSVAAVISRALAPG